MSQHEHPERSDGDRALCCHWIEVPGDEWAGTSCKLLDGHAGEHSAHYPPGHAARMLAQSEKYR